MFPSRRFLRVGWLIACCVPSLALTYLWWRSHYWADINYINLPATRIEVLSVEGRLKFTRVHGAQTFQGTPSHFRVGEPNAETVVRHMRNFDSKFGIGIVHGKNSALLLPYWLVLVTVIALSIAAASIRWSASFRLRTLLLTMTVTAILTAFIAWWLR